MGPSIGWTRVPLQNVLNAIAGGTYALDPSISLVAVNSPATPVTITLPSAASPSSGITRPGLLAGNPITIADVGGNAGAHTITIQRNNPSESIAGAASVQITTAYGTLMLLPNPNTLTWNII
jgi:hypothetical protein